MSSIIGNRKSAAARLGMTFERYMDMLKAGRKRCSACKKWKPREWFYPNRYRMCGISAYCIVCSKADTQKRKAKKKVKT